MAYSIYMNNCKDGDFHVGMHEGKDWLVYRTLEKYETGLVVSLVKVSLNDSVERTWENIDAVVKEAFDQIDNLEYNRLYQKTTSLGDLDLVAEKGFGENLTSIKEELRYAAKLLVERGRNISIK